MTTNSNERNNSRNSRNSRNNPRDNDGIVEKVVQVRRVTKVVKGGRNLRFSAMVVAGDRKGKVGVASGKGAAVPDAVRKASIFLLVSVISIVYKFSFTSIILPWNVSTTRFITSWSLSFLATTFDEYILRRWN